jgi:hypothetical protein
LFVLDLDPTAATAFEGVRFPLGLIEFVTIEVIAPLPGSPAAQFASRAGFEFPVAL